MSMPPIAVTAGAWIWDKYGETVVEKATGAIKDRWNKFKWRGAAEDYRAKIKKLYGTMQIMGMAKPVPLDDIFTDVYMLDKPTAFGRFDIARLKQMSALDPLEPPHTKRINGLRLVGDKGNLFILGKPGAGKTTFLKYIAIKAAEQTIDKVPVFVSLKEWADSGSELLSFIAERFDICGFPAAEPFVEELLKSGTALVLFDGLDEVNQESGQRDEQTRAMNNFVEKYDLTQCLITCRIAASDYSFQPYTYVEIADFTEKQIQTFVGNWFRKEGERDEEICKKFLTEFNKEDNKGLRDLARTPLLLTLLCLAFNETLTFPQRRVEIYEEAVDALLKKWDASRRIRRDEVYRKLSLGHKENMLTRIAAETFEKNDYFIPQSELEKRILDYVRNVPPHDTNETADGEAILKAIEAQHGVFVERAREVYSFSHLTFQEYFTAKYIVANASKGTLKNLIREHCAELRWREVFLLTTSLLPDAGLFMTAFRRNIDGFVEDDEKLLKLLDWAANKRNSIETAPWLVGPSYLLVELYYRSRGSVLPSALARALDLDRDLDLNLNLAHDYAHALDHGLELDLALARALALAIALTRDLYASSPLSPDLYNQRLRSILHSFTSDLSLARDMALDLGLDRFAAELDTLLRLKDEVYSVQLQFGATTQSTRERIMFDVEAAAKWQKLATTLQALVVNNRGIGHEWHLTEAQQEGLSNYLNATHLLQDCLELAFMPPDEKQAILNSLYSPPARSGSEPNA